jgi:hypothetical protein
MPKTKSAAKKTSGSDTLKIAVTTGPKKCKPFELEVMVFAPSSGFKIEVKIERSCTPQADAIWKIVFDLYKKKAGADGFTQLVHVSYTGGTPVEQKGLEATAIDGVNEDQADVIVTKVGPAVLALKDASTMTPAQLEKKKETIRAGSKEIATLAL